MEGVANASTWLQGEADLLGHCFESFECKFVLVSPHTCTLGQGQGFCFGMSCARWTRFVHLCRWLRDIQACQKQRGESWAVSVKSTSQAWQFVPFNRESGNIESMCCTTTFTPSQSNAECFDFRLPSCLVTSSYASWPFVKVAQAVKAAVEAEKALYDSAYRTGKHIGFNDLDDTRPNDQ